jgi:predicted nucleotidyltransferase
VNGPPLTEDLQRLALFVQAWNQPAALIGGMAIGARVRVRYTRDLDLMLVVPPGREEALLSTARNHGYQYDEAEIRHLLPGGLARLWGPPDSQRGMPVDLLFVDSPFTEELVSRATELDLLGTRLRVATIEDLVLLKLEANRPQDIDDILAIKDAFSGRLDRSYLDRQAARLGVQERLRLYLDTQG